MATFEVSDEDISDNPSFLVKIKSDPKEVLKFVRQHRAVVDNHGNIPEIVAMRSTIVINGHFVY